MLKLHVFYKEVTYRENVNWGGSLQGGPELDLPWALEGVWSSGPSSKDLGEYLSFFNSQGTDEWA